jgi:hypothetical protein
LHITDDCRLNYVFFLFMWLRPNGIFFVKSALSHNKSKLSTARILKPL